MLAYRPRLGPRQATTSESTSADPSTQSLIPTRLAQLSLRPSTSQQQPLTATAGYLKADDLLRLRLLAAYLNVPIFNLPEKFGVQASAPRWNRGENEGVPYLLGTGVSCTVVQHETDDSTTKAVESGTIVALKRYTHDASTDDLASDKGLAEVILQDLRVLCHPRLRSHENFCRLLYISWEPYSLIPALALELAAFGTLHDALASEFKMSWLQKCHVSLDITLGLHHLHDCGLVHGDIKPANIMLQEHNSRQVVAKLMDFSGVTDTVHYGTATHSQFMSRMWLPPEKLLARSKVDYKKADTYAYGMVMTQIWCDIDFEVYECYLETLVPEFFTVTEKQTLMLYYKCCSKTDANSLLNHSRTLIAASDDYSRSRLVGFPLEVVQEGTLVPDPNERWDFEQILQQFHDFAQDQGREIPVCLDTTSILREENEFWNYASRWSFFLTSDEHKKVVLQYMVKAAGPPEAADNLLIPGTESDYQEKDRLLNLLWQNTRAEIARSPKQKYKSNLYYQIAMCYFMGLGTKIDEVEALKYLAMAAKNFARRAMFMFTSVEASTNAAPIPHMPHRLLLSIAYLNDSTESVDLLKKSYPSLLAILKTIRFEKGLTLHRTICDKTADIQGDVSTGPPARSNDIFELINSEDIDALQRLLNDDPSLASESKYGLSTLHALSLISDEVAMQMATVLLTAGASLDAFSYESHQPSKNRLDIGHGTPLTWAVTNQKPRLFASLVQWHIQHETLPNVGRRSLGFLPLYYGQSEMARYLIEVQSKMVQSDEARAKEFFWSIGSENIPDDRQGDFDFGAPQAEAAQAMQGLSWRDLHAYQLHAALEKNDTNTVLRRWLLGGNYRHSRMDIANLVAQWVTEFVDIPDIHENPISEAILKGDGISLLAFMDTLKLKGYDLDQILGPQGVLRRGVSSPLKWSVLHGTLSARSMEAFTMLLPRVRHLIEVPSDAGHTALIRASGGGNVEAVRNLLEYNANVLHYAKNGANALVVALAFNYRSIAELLLTKCEVSTALGPNSHGVTAFGQVLGTYLSGRRQIQISTFDFFRQHNALSFTPNGKDNIWRMVFTKDRASLAEHRAADLRLFRYFLRDDVFGRHINDLDWTGRTALHYAAYYNHYEALEILLDRHASVNIENLPADERGQRHGGKTAADFALLARVSGPPKHVLAGGAQEVRAWQNRNEVMLKLLVDRGAESGSGKNGYNFMEIAKIKDPQAFRRVHIQNWARPPRGDLTWRGKWPKRIPNCLSKTSHSPNQPKPWRDDDSDDSETPDSQTQISQTEPILYRTPGGRKMRISPQNLNLLGPILGDAQGPTYSEEDKQRGYDLLQKAQTFIAARRAEQESTQVTNCPQPQRVFTQTNVEKS